MVDDRHAHRRHAEHIGKLVERNAPAQGREFDRRLTRVALDRCDQRPGDLQVHRSPKRGIARRRHDASQPRMHPPHLQVGLVADHVVTLRFDVGDQSLDLRLGLHILDQAQIEAGHGDVRYDGPCLVADPGAAHSPHVERWLIDQLQATARGLGGGQSELAHLRVVIIRRLG